MNKQQKTLDRLAFCTNLPSPPGVAVRILELGQNPDTTLDDVAKNVSLDAAISAKIIRFANSPLYARRRKADNIRQAIALFGLNGTLTMALSFSILSHLPQQGSQGLDYPFFWRRAFTTAICSQKLAEACAVERHDELFLAGLLQDIGMLALDQVDESLYQQVNAHQYDHRLLQDYERQSIAMDHAATGAWLLEHWHFPSTLIQAVAGSHNPEASDIATEHRQTAAIMACASDMAEHLCYQDCTREAAQFASKCRHLLGLEPEPLAPLVAGIADDVQEMADLYEIDMGNTAYMEAIAERAKETLMLRNLNTIQETMELKKTADTLKHRARELEEENRRDGLTGLFNRSHFKRSITDEFACAESQGWPLTLAFIDIDHFKQVNDNYGHQTGDQVLRHVAGQLILHTRGSDIVARYGGEEFVILMPGTNSEGAWIVCQRILISLRENGYQRNGAAAIMATVSIGIAVHGESSDYQDPEKLIRAADKAVYSAKLAGRDQIEFFHSDPEPE